jgi:hypothetical protein
MQGRLLRFGGIGRRGNDQTGGKYMHEVHQ